ncbi:MAG TPA: hypothetical protein VIS06_16085 [Mycobacteriales bacterium]
MKLFEHADEDYATAATAAGVKELPDDGKPAPRPGPLPDRVVSGRWDDNNPPGCPR